MKALIKLGEESYNVVFGTSEYQQGGLAVFLTDLKTGEPFSTLSVWVPMTRDLPSGAFYCKHWGGNEEVVEQLYKQGLIVPVMAQPASSGFIEEILAYRLKDWEDQRNV